MILKGECWLEHDVSKLRNDRQAAYKDEVKDWIPGNTGKTENQLEVER